MPREEGWRAALGNQVYKGIGRNQVSVSILRKGVTFWGVFRRSLAPEISLGKALGAHEAKGGMRKHKGCPSLARCEDLEETTYLCS